MEGTGESSSWNLCCPHSPAGVQIRLGEGFKEGPGWVSRVQRVTGGEGRGLRPFFFFFLLTFLIICTQKALNIDIWTK